MHSIKINIYICITIIVCINRYLIIKTMKVTVNINLGGYAFNVDEDAYDRLRQYMKSLEKEFSGESSAAEIMTDIEGRIAELFRAKLSGYKQVITMKDVEEVMAILGAPEVISGSSSGSGTTEERTGRSPRRIYRDPDGRIIGGVCAGLGAYFDWDPLIWRVIFGALVIAGGFGIALYLILWIIVPEAKTTAQKLEMRGDPVTIENIKDSVKQEFDTVKKKMNL